MENYTEDESKIDIAETYVNLNYIKAAQDEEAIDFEEIGHIKTSKINLENNNVFSEIFYKKELKEDDNLINHPDNVIMKNEFIKLESVEDEDNSNYLYCSKCNGIYDTYCLKCSTLVRILNNRVQLTNSQLEINTVPRNILEIRDNLAGNRAFLLKTLPKDVIFGPFEGISGIESTKGHCWKINDKTLVNNESSNWMKDIGSAVNASFKNLDIFQIEGNLFYKTNREIMEGEELLVYYDDEKIQRMDNSGECYYTPLIHEKSQKIFSCTLCCLGFSLDKCLMEHNSKCHYADHNRNIKDFELIECHYCNIGLEKHDYWEHHLPHCKDKSSRIWSNCTEDDRIGLKQEEMDDHLIIKENRKEYKCSQCSFQTNYKTNLQSHFKTHTKPYGCDNCAMKFSKKVDLKIHIKNKHAEAGSEKDYNCLKCSYQTNYRSYFQKHVNMHNDVKLIQCDICLMKFTMKGNLKTHMENKHTEKVNKKKHKCPECSFQTNYASSYQGHLNTHKKPFQCDFCTLKFATKASLVIHVKDKHSEDGSVKDYKCAKCSYQTNYKSNLKIHINTHNDIKPFECGICRMKFTQKQYLKIHIKNKHTANDIGKNYKCLECSYQTDDEDNLEKHLKTHYKPYQCDICTVKFAKKFNLNAHLKNKHRNSKDYKCSECSYETNYKGNLKLHMNTHSGIKPFHCDICMTRFRQKHHLKVHKDSIHG